MQVKGYESKVTVRLFGPDDLTGADLVAQIRERSCDEALLGELSTDDSTITVGTPATTDVDEYDTFGDFPAIGVAGTIYVASDKDTEVYFWSGAQYVAYSGVAADYAYTTDVTLTFPEDMTAAGWPDLIETDIVRVDSTPDAHFGFILKIPFTGPVTRLTS